MHIIKSIDNLRKNIKQLKHDNKTIGFVPTMGNLHSGHLSLIDKAHELCDTVISSIFVNPLQFAENEDLDLYPRTLNDDLKFLKEHHCDYVFTPDSVTIIGNSNTTRVAVPNVGEGLEADVREGHLEGVATIVTKLFNLVQPDIACFGKKDYQQWLMIKKMVLDLNLDIRVIGCRTMREKDGLAMSSRNQYLDARQRKTAPKFHQILLKCAQSMQANNSSTALEKAKNELLRNGFSIDYFELRKQQTLAPTESIDNAVIVATVRLGETRLLDNIEL